MVGLGAVPDFQLILPAFTRSACVVTLPWSRSPTYRTCVRVVWYPSCMSTASFSSPSEAALIEELASLTRQENALAARRQDLILAFARAHVESQIASGSVEPEKLERSIAAQIGYACQVSATEGRRRMRMARDLHNGLTHVRELFAAGSLSEYRTSIIVAATAHLDPDERAAVDQRLDRAPDRDPQHPEARRPGPEAGRGDLPGEVRGPLPRRPNQPTSDRAPGTGRDGLPDRAAPARRGRGLLRSPAQGRHRGRRLARTGHPQPRADHGRQVGRTDHRTSRRERGEHRGPDPGPPRSPHRPRQPPPRRAPRLRPDSPPTSSSPTKPAQPGAG